jgi:hypothetical protein
MEIYIFFIIFTPSVALSYLSPFSLQNDSSLFCSQISEGTMGFTYVITIGAIQEGVR